MAKLQSYDETRENDIKESPFHISSKDLAAKHPEGRKLVLKKMEMQLATMNEKGKMGHWTYNKEHHMKAHKIYQSEKEDYEQAKKDDRLDDRMEQHKTNKKRETLAKASADKAKAKAKSKPKAKKKKIKEQFLLTPNGRSQITE
jgi:hypothetical protein